MSKYVAIRLIGVIPSEERRHAVCGMGLRRREGAIVSPDSNFPVRCRTRSRVRRGYLVSRLPPPAFCRRADRAKGKGGPEDDKETVQQVANRLFVRRLFGIVAEQPILGGWVTSSDSFVRGRAAGMRVPPPRRLLPCGFRFGAGGRFGLEDGQQVVVRTEQEQHRTVHVVADHGVEHLHELGLGLHARAGHPRRCQRSEAEGVLAAERVAAHQAVAGADARDAFVVAQHDGVFALLGGDAPAAELHELPLGSDQRTAVFLLERTAVAAGERNGQQGDACGDLQKSVHFIRCFIVILLQKSLQI